jgi:hypothetical protein
MFPFAKRRGILRFRPLFAAGYTKRFLHCMQIMAQSAVLMKKCDSGESPPLAPSSTPLARPHLPSALCTSGATN